MAGNQRIIKTSKVKQKQADNHADPSTPEGAKKRAEKIAKDLHRMEVDIFMAQRRSLQEQLHGYDTLPPIAQTQAPRGQVRLPLGQIAELKKMLRYKLLEWLITCVLIAGISAWLYKWYLFKIGI